MEQPFDHSNPHIIGLLLQQLPGMYLAVNMAGHFRLEQKKPQTGILAVTGKTLEIQPDVLMLEMDLARIQGKIKLEAGRVFSLLSLLGDKTFLIGPVMDDSGMYTFRAGLKIQSGQLSMSRTTLLVVELQKINQLAELLQQELPTANLQGDKLREVYKNVKEFIEPVLPYENGHSPETHLARWCAEIVDLHFSGLCQALVMQSVLQGKFVLACLAEVLSAKNSSLGHLILTTINPAKLPELLQKAPGVAVIPATAMSTGSNLYDRSNEIVSMLELLTYSTNPPLFVGEESQLQAVFHGGQGGKSDPLMPVVHYTPPISRSELIRFGVIHEAGKHGGLTGAAIDTCIKELNECFADHGENEQVMLSVISACVSKAVKSSPPASHALKNLRETIGEKNNTFSGLSVRSRTSRKKNIQHNWTEKIISNDLFGYFTRSLFAQDEAIGNLCSRLQTEVLTRPPHQPLRYCAQGTPGIGKSESTVLLANLLGVPYVNIDAASIPDIYTGSAMLLGSGRGLVGSYQAGRLEQASKHQTGTVVEISDLDHARPEVRCALADLFLQVLETGEAQSASGAMFSCANMIFVFTINLPNGQDEYVRRSVGFGGSADSLEIRKRIIKELKKTFSTAFVSRMGKPVIFNPLTGSAKKKIIESACIKAIDESMKRLNVGISGISVTEDAIQQILTACSEMDMTSGARGIIETSRQMVADAVLNQLDTLTTHQNMHLELQFLTRLSISIK